MGLRRSMALVWPLDGIGLCTLNKANWMDLNAVVGNSSCNSAFWISHASSSVMRDIDCRVV